MLPFDLTLLGLEVSSVGLFDDFTVRVAGGRLAFDVAQAALHMREQQEYSAALRAWCESRQIDMSYHAQDPRFAGLLDRSRTHWGLDPKRITE
ncbi:hypothetical protein [Pseudarthrobacter sp. S9]|uniref:hypothetical protein n=1 Tax=Pseudarthrobacter sp. S9 TaxID=3418421 RepID=UPI003D092A03